MDRRDHLRPVPDCRGNTLHRAGADVTNGEHAAAARLERQPAVVDVVTREHESPFVELEPGRAEPVGIRLRSYKGEEVTDRPFGDGAGSAIAPADAFEHAGGARKLVDFTTDDDIDVRLGVDPEDQILRHRVAQG